MTEHAIICVTFTAGSVASVDSVIKAIETALPVFFVPEGDLKDAIALLRVGNDHKITMVHKHTAFPNDMYADGRDFLFRRITYKMRLGPMITMPSLLFFTNGETSFLQLRFPTPVYDRISGGSGRSFDADIKRLVILVASRFARALGLAGFSAAIGEEDAIDPSPEIATIVRFVGDPLAWLMDPTKYLFAACREALVEQTFEVDVDEPPHHYHCEEFAVFDCFWPA